MPEETQKKFYKTTVNGRPSYEVLPEVGNVPQGYTPITAGEFQSGLQQQLSEEEANLASKPYAAGTIAPAIEALKGRIKEFSIYAPEASSAGPSGYVMVGGVPMTKASYEQQQANTAGVASGALKEIAPGQYVPAGSPATATPVSTYTGPSVVDYLASIGRPADFASRKILAQSLGIQNYRGTASENTQMLDTLRKGAPQTTPAPSATPAPAGGATSTTPTPTAPPVTNMGTPAPTTPATFTETYKQALETTGVNNVKSEFDKVQGEYDSLQNELNDKITEISDNPWISEGLRSKKITSLQGKYEGKLSILTNKLKLYDSLHQQAQIEAKFLASGTQDQSQFDQNTQIKLYELAQKEAEAKAKLLEINPANFKEVSGGLVDVSTGTWVIPPKKETGGLTNTQIDNGRAIVNSFEGSPIIKNFLEIQDRYLNAKTYTGRGDGATDIATIYDLMKVLDPTSVVREAEYATGADKSGNIFVGALAKFNGLIDPKGGFVSEVAKDNIFQVIEDRYNTRKAVYDNFRTQKQTELASVAPGMNLIDYSSVTPETTPAPKFISDTEANKITNSSDVQSDPAGFFDSFLNVFGLKTK